MRQRQGRSSAPSGTRVAHSPPRQGPGPRENPSDMALSLELPVGFEPTTPALQLRSRVGSGRSLRFCLIFTSRWSTG